MNRLNPISQIYSAQANGKHIFKCLTTNVIRLEDNIKIWSALFFKVEQRGQKVNYMQIIGEWFKNDSRAANKSNLNDTTTCKRLKATTKTKN